MTRSAGTTFRSRAVLTTSAANPFLDLVEKSGLLTPTQVRTVFPDGRGTATACADRLVRAGLLTEFQADCLLQGKHRGLVLGPYHILQPIGAGGMGAVYLAEHAGLGRKVAVKVLPPEQAKDRLAVGRFMREARSAAALDHPNIVRLYDACQQGEVRYLVLEYVDGMTLEAAVSDRGPVPAGRAAGYAAQVAAGLRHAHERGFVHRDIKPANLMATADGAVKILDMGLARSVAAPADNLTGRLGDGSDAAGSVDFISPEQALGLPADGRADVYSLGATLYLLLTGVPPFHGSAAQKLLQHQTADPPRASEVLASVPPGLCAVVRRMMAKKPAARYDADEVAQALGPWVPAGGAVAAPARGPAGLGGAVTAGVCAVAGWLGRVARSRG